MCAKLRDGKQKAIENQTPVQSKCKISLKKNQSTFKAKLSIFFQNSQRTFSKHFFSDLFHVFCAKLKDGTQKAIENLTPVYFGYIMHLKKF